MQITTYISYIYLICLITNMLVRIKYVYLIMEINWLPVYVMDSYQTIQTEATSIQHSTWGSALNIQANILPNIYKESQLKQHYIDNVQVVLYQSILTWLWWIYVYIYTIQSLLHINTYFKILTCVLMYIKISNIA